MICRHTFSVWGLIWCVGWVEELVESSLLGARPSVYARTEYRALLVSIQGIAAWSCPKFWTFGWLSYPTRLPTSYCGFRPNDLRDQRGHDLWFSQNEVLACVCVCGWVCESQQPNKIKMVIQNPPCRQSTPAIIAIIDMQYIR